jgi:serine/threonine protein kinase
VDEDNGGDLMIGNIVGNYRITGKIGEGGMGEVFKGMDLMLEREVAIKMLHPDIARQPQVVERFRTEAVTHSRLNHPHIATLYAFFRHENDYFMVMEYVPGETLDHVLQRSGPLPSARALPLFYQVLEGIEYAHQLNVIHRDIKPANIMVTAQGGLKVMDFGIARKVGSSRLTRTGHLVGTFEYMSPEQIQGLEVDARSDIYSLGILLYELLTGRLPFGGSSEYELMKSQIESVPPPPRQFAAGIPVPVEEAILRALAKRPEERFQTIAEFRSALRNSESLTSAEVPRAAPEAFPVTSPSIPTPPVLAAPRGVKAASPVPEATGPISAEFRETRLAPEIVSPPSLDPSARPESIELSATTPRQGSIFQRLDWQYVVGAVVLIAAIGISLWLIFGTHQPVARKPESGPAGSLPSPTVSPNAEPSNPPTLEASPTPQPVMPTPSPTPSLMIAPEGGPKRPSKPSQKEDDKNNRKLKEFLEKIK